MSTQDSYVAPAVVASGTTYAQLKTGGLNAVIQNMLATNAAVANPTSAVTASATGGGASGGSLPAGAYFASYTWVTPFGETTPGTSEIGSAVTIAAGNIPRFTIPALPTGAISANLYLSLVGGASGSEILYATGITGTTFDASFAAGSDPSSPVPPTLNTTAATSNQPLIDIPLNEPNSRFFGHIFGLIDTFLRGDPVALQDLKARHRNHAAAVTMYKQALDEIGVLINANPGTIGTTTNASSGMIFPVRVLA